MCQAQTLREAIDDAGASAAIEASARAYGAVLTAKPMEIPAFQMRDIAIPFGADRTPIEAICASSLLKQYGGSA